MEYLQERQVDGFRAYYEGIMRADNPWGEQDNRNSRYEWWQGWDKAAKGANYKASPSPAPRAEMPECVERILAILQGYNAHVSPEYWNGTVKPAIAAVRAHFAAPEKREEQAEKDRRLGEAMRWYLENAPSATSLITMNGRRQIMTWIVGNYREFDNADSLASAIIAEKEGQA